MSVWTTIDPTRRRRAELLIGMLHRRAKYNGRKGRRATVRLRELGYVVDADGMLLPQWLLVQVGAIRRAKIYDFVPDPWYVGPRDGEEADRPVAPAAGEMVGADSPLPLPRRPLG